jgi:hemerythrin-like domain-containing protein
MMIITLESLYRDHDNLRRVLYLFEQLLIDIYRGSSEDYEMLQRILAYIQDYPDRVHHPAEDAMFSVILNDSACSRKYREDIHALVKEHSNIEGITRNAIEAVESLILRTQPDITSIGDSLSTLLNRQRSHLLFEEMNIYPNITHYLNDEDWIKVSALYAGEEDPIFGDKVKTGYEDIFRAL